MPDLSVTDIQKMLREHAGLGHDVITNPKTVHIGEISDPLAGMVPFGMAIYHELKIHNNLRNSELSSFVAHGEKPSASNILSHVSHQPHGAKLLSRGAYGHEPHLHINSEGVKEHDFANYDDDPYIYYESKNYRTPSSIHDVLKTHLDKSIDYHSHVYNDEDNYGQNITKSNKFGWNAAEAAKGVAGLYDLKPFSGFIKVYVHGRMLDGAHHIYNPQTERLTKLGD